MSLLEGQVANLYPAKCEQDHWCSRPTRRTPPFSFLAYFRSSVDVVTLLSSTFEEMLCTTAGVLGALGLIIFAYLYKSGIFAKVSVKDGEKERVPMAYVKMVGSFSQIPGAINRSVELIEKYGGKSCIEGVAACIFLDSPVKTPSGECT